MREIQLQLGANERGCDNLAPRQVLNALDELDKGRIGTAVLGDTMIGITLGKLKKHSNEEVRERASSLQLRLKRAWKEEGIPSQQKGRRKEDAGKIQKEIDQEVSRRSTAEALRKEVEEEMKETKKTKEERVVPAIKKQV